MDSNNTSSYRYIIISKKCRKMSSQPNVDDGHVLYNVYCTYLSLEYPRFKHWKAGPKTSPNKNLPTKINTTKLKQHNVSM